MFLLKAMVVYVTNIENW